MRAIIQTCSMDEEVIDVSETLPRDIGLVAHIHQPLIAVPVENNGEEAVCYFVDEAQADAALGQSATMDAIKLAGVWSDLDGDNMLAALERIRHESKATPPIDSI